MFAVDYFYLYVSKSLFMFFGMVSIYAYFYLSKKNLINSIVLCILFGSLSNFILFEKKDVKEKVYLVNKKIGDLEFQSYEDKRLHKEPKEYHYEKQQLIELSN